MFLIGRYLYLTDRISKMPKVTFNRLRGQEAVSYYLTDEKTGEVKRRRFTNKHPQWDKVRQMAAVRLSLQEQLNKVRLLWRSNYNDSLIQAASSYMLKPNADNRIDSALWESLKSGENKYKNDHPVIHNGMIMRSQFEANVADILERLGIEYKYDAVLQTGASEIVSPDFSLNFPEFNRSGFIEALGALDNLGYIGHNTEKFRKYLNAGIYPNRDLIFIPGDYNYRPDETTIIRMINVMLDSFARQYVIKKPA